MTTTGGAGCVPDDVLDPLGEFISAMDASASVVAGHGFAGEAVAFFQAPGLPSPPALLGSFAGLFMQCSMPVLFDPFCEQGRCSRLECPGRSTNWINHLYLERPPFVAGGFTFDSVTLDVRWSEGSDGVAYDLVVESTGPADRIWNMSATGAIDETTWTLNAVFPSLLDAGEATLSVSEMAGLTATLAVDGVIVAEGVPLTLTDMCP